MESTSAAEAACTFATLSQRWNLALSAVEGCCAYPRARKCLAVSQFETRRLSVPCHPPFGPGEGWGSLFRGSACKKAKLSQPAALNLVRTGSSITKSRR